jgi:nitroreductase
MQLDKAIESRRSVKKFKDKKPDWRDIIEAIDMARFAPMAGNMFSLKFIIVSDPNKIQKLADAAQQNFISKAHYVVVACSNPNKTTASYDKRAAIYLRQQAGAGIQNFLLKLAEIGLSTTWVGHFVESMVKTELRIPEGVNVEAMFPIGYEFKKPTTTKAKTDLNAILYFNLYGHKHMRQEEKLDV